MPKNEPSKLPRQAVIYAVLFGIGILAFVLLGIYPNYADMKKLEREAIELKAEIDGQRVLAPYYKRLATLSKRKPPTGLTIPRQTRLSQDEINQISSTFSDLARQNNLEMYTLSPDLDSFIGDLGLLKMALTVAGRYDDLRQYLLKLAEMPYMAHIENMALEAKSKTLQLSLQLWLAQK